MKIKRILIGIDDSKYADHAAKYGFELAHTLDAAVGLVNIIEPMVPPVNTGTDAIMGLPFQTDNMLNSMDIIDVQNDLSENIINKTIKNYAGNLKVTHFNASGSTADGIVACSKEFAADLIVIGSHHRSGIDRLLNGSVAEDVVRHADVPVMVVPYVEKD